MTSWLQRGALVVSLAAAACAPVPAKSVPAHTVLPLPVPPLCPTGNWQWSADGSAVLSSCEAGVEIRDGSSGNVRAQRAAFPERLWGEINADASVVALPRPGRVELRSGEDLSLQSILLLDANSAVAPLVTFSADGKRLAALQLPSLLVEVSLPDARVLWRVNDAIGPGSMPTRLRYIGGTVHVSMASGMGRAAAFNGGQPVTPRWMRQERRFDVERDARRLLLFSTESSTTVWDVATDQPLSAHERPFNAGERWLGDYIATDQRERGIQLTRSDAQEKWLVPAGDVLTSQVTSDGGHFRTAANGDLIDWTLPGLAAVRLAWPPSPTYELLDHGYFVETRASGLTLRRLSDRQVVAQQFGAPPSLRTHFATANGELVTVVSGAGAGRVLHITGNGNERHLDGIGRDLVLDPYSPRAAYVLDQTIHIIDLRTLTHIASLPEPRNLLRFQFRSPQNQLVTLNRLGGLTFVDIRSGQVALEAQLPIRYGELIVSPNGEYVAHSGSGLISVWSAAGVQEWADPDWQSASFSADSRAIRLLSKTKLVTRELATGRVSSEETLPRDAHAQLVGDWLFQNWGEQSIRSVSAGPWRALPPPAINGVRVLGIRAGVLSAFDRGGSFLRWSLGEARVADPISVPSGDNARLSPDNSLLSIRSERAAKVFDLTAKKDVSELNVAAWSIDGSAFLRGETLVQTEGSIAGLELPGALAFAGDAHSILASNSGNLVLYDARTPIAEPRIIARNAQLVAQSSNQLTLAVATDRGRSLSLLRAPSWQPRSQPLPINGAQVVALSDTGNILAVLNESNELEVRAVTPTRSKLPTVHVTLPPAPAVSRMLFSPDSRFLFLEGTPLRVLRLADGEILNAYVARSERAERLSAPLLFVDARGKMEGDPALARQLYCDSLPIKLTPRIQPAPCAMPSASQGLTARFFAPH